MIVIFLLIPLSIITASVFLAGFIWAVRSGQFEDTCTPALRMLSEDPDSKRAPEKTRKLGGIRNKSGQEKMASPEKEFARKVE